MSNIGQNVQYRPKCPCLDRYFTQGIYMHYLLTKCVLQAIFKRTTNVCYVNFNFIRNYLLTNFLPAYPFLRSPITIITLLTPVFMEKMCVRVWVLPTCAGVNNTSPQL